MALGQVMAPALAGNAPPTLMVPRGSLSGEQCSGSEFWNVPLRHSVNGYALRDINSVMKRPPNSCCLRPRASGQLPFNPLQYQSYSVPSLNWRNNGVKRLIQGYKEQEAMQRGRPVEFSESTIASLFSERTGTCHRKHFHLQSSVGISCSCLCYCLC
jgi:hypothetical protein